MPRRSTQSRFRRLAGRARWLVPGIGVKRWLLLLMVGSAVNGLGLLYLVVLLRDTGLLPASSFARLMLPFLPDWLRVVLPVTLGSALVFVAVYRLVFNLLAPFRRPDQMVADSLYEYSQRNRGPNVVTIGGGTGLPSLLRGLKEYTSNITAIVTVADDGGSSGRLRRELGVIPPGDFRNNIAALASDEALMTQLLQYRFGSAPNPNGNGQGGLQGHAFGNLLLAALAGISGSFDEALLAAGRVLAIRGQVLPSTLDNVTLVAEVEMSGAAAGTRRVVGESAIPKTAGRIRRITLEPEDARAYPRAVQAILQADLIIIGPGSLYTSIIPNLLVRGLAAALGRSRAPKVYICNLAIQPGETDNYTVADHVAAVAQYLPPDCLNVVLANDNLSVSPGAGGGYTVFVQPAPLQQERVRLILADLVDRGRPWRHDSIRLAEAVMALVGKE